MRGRTDTPFGPGVRLGRVGGIQLIAHWSVLGTVGLVAILLATSELPSARPHQSPALYWLVGIAAAVLFVASIAAHEVAHAIVARRFGMRVDKMTLWLLGGLTELNGEPPSPRADAWIAISGPLTTIALGACFGAAAYLAGTGTILGSALFWLAAMSAVLAVFNLVPAAPLDGGRVLRAIMWRTTGDRMRAAAAAARAGQVVGMVLLGLGFLAVLAGDLFGFWSALLGWFILGGARSERYVGRAERLAELTAGDVMRANPTGLPKWWTVANAVSELGPGAAWQAIFPVVDLDGHAIGAVTIIDLERVPASAADEVRVGDLRRRAVPLVPPQTPLNEVLLAIHLRAPCAVVVDDAGRPLGVIDEHLIEHAARLAALSSAPKPGGTP
ncbi:MAG TPA: site-2 protease family protein [Jatrophihabitans sp.]|nr:site-2 protease family protein [Jatrophihabitans sp.]